MRSTPWPNDTLRTVNDARVPPRCIPITTPSKIWMRSLSPSRTFTCTRTVSPAFMAGRSASCDFSTTSIALMSQLLENLSLFFVQIGAGQQIRAAFERARERLALPPSSDVGVIARQQDVRHAHPIDLRRPRELREIEQPAAERIAGHRLFVPDHARHEPRDRVHDHQRRQ